MLSIDEDLQTRRIASVTCELAVYFVRSMYSVYIIDYFMPYEMFTRPCNFNEFFP